MFSIEFLQTLVLKENLLKLLWVCDPWTQTTFKPYCELDQIVYTSPLNTTQGKYHSKGAQVESTLVVYIGHGKLGRTLLVPPEVPISFSLHVDIGPVDWICNVALRERPVLGTIIGLLPRWVVKKMSSWVLPPPDYLSQIHHEIIPITSEINKTLFYHGAAKLKHIIQVVTSSSLCTQFNLVTKKQFHLQRRMWQNASEYITNCKIAQQI